MSFTFYWQSILLYTFTILVLLTDFRLMARFIALFVAVRNYNLDLTAIQTTVPTVTFSLPLLGIGFLRRTFHFLWIPKLSPASATSNSS
jgi:hypothetical protein